MKNIFIAILLLGLSNCGGGGVSEPSTTPNPEPPVVPPITGVSVKVTSSDANNISSHACHSPSSNETMTMFSDITDSAGLNFSHLMQSDDGFFGQSGGVSAGDIDNDGWLDLYVIGGDGQTNLLLKNTADGSFENIAESALVNVLNKGIGPSFADINGDGLVDLFVGNVEGDNPRLFVNKGDNTFDDITDSSGLDLPGNNVSAAWSDIDHDDDLDLVVTHWSRVSKQYYPYLWRNNGDQTFTDISLLAGISQLSFQDNTFTPNFADVNNDGWQDLLMTSDSNQTRLYINNQDSTFTDTTDEEVFTDNSGMGAAIGDFDNDGDLDWFVTATTYEDLTPYSSSYTTGNRLYENQGDGTFVDKTGGSNLFNGFWGWGTCFSDFNNDGALDIFLVNGMEGNGIDTLFKDDPSKLFFSNGDGSFTESAVASGIDDRGMGRGLVCFDYDRDGDQDLYIANHNQPPKLYCNNGNTNNFLNIRLVEKSINKQAIGARIYVKTELVQQMRELRLSNNYVSQNPVEAHFGLNNQTEIEFVKVVWPDGEETQINNIQINKFVVIERL